MNKVRIKYTEDWSGQEGLVVDTNTGDGWEFSVFYPLVAKVGADAVGREDEKNFVHWRILRRISEYMNMGYKVEIDI